MDFTDNLVMNAPSYFVIFLKGVLLWMSSALGVILDFVFTKFSGLIRLGDLFYRDQFILIYSNSGGWFT